MENTQLITPEEIARRQERANRMDQAAGVARNSFDSIKIVKVHNPNKDKPSEIGAVIGDLVSSVKTENGFENAIEKRPMDGIILKVRWYLKNKFKFSNRKLTSTEFDSFSPNELITIKEIETENDKVKFTPIFTGNYKEVNAKFSLRDEMGDEEKKLDLCCALYVLTNFEEKTIVKVDFKGMSRSNFFLYMKNFNKKLGESMTQMYTAFDSEVNTHNSLGKAMQSPVAAITFTKKMFVPEARMDELEAIQQELTEALNKRDEAFGSPMAKIEEGAQIDQLGDGSQSIPLETSQVSNESIPVIQLDDEIEQDKLLDTDSIDEIKIDGSSPY